MALVLLALQGATVVAQDLPAPQGLRYCAPPVRPTCVDGDTTYGNPAQRNACQQAMDSYVKTVFVYRECLNAEMERAVRQTNDTIARHKCRLRGERTCP